MPILHARLSSPTHCRLSLKSHCAPCSGIAARLPCLTKLDIAGCTGPFLTHSPRPRWTIVAPMISVKKPCFRERRLLDGRTAVAKAPEPWAATLYISAGDTIHSQSPKCIVSLYISCTETGAIHFVHQTAQHAVLRSQRSTAPGRPRSGRRLL